MRIDEENYLRNIGWQGKTSNVFIGDVANVSLRSLGPHDPPKFSKKPDYDEQKWVLSSSSGELKIIIEVLHIGAWDYLQNASIMKSS